jgi:hypothetical protein
MRNQVREVDAALRGRGVVPFLRRYPCNHTVFNLRRESEWGRQRSSVVPFGNVPESRILRPELGLQQFFDQLRQHLGEKRLL